MPMCQSLVCSSLMELNFTQLDIKFPSAKGCYTVLMYRNWYTKKLGLKSTKSCDIHVRETVSQKTIKKKVAVNKLFQPPAPIERQWQSRQYKQGATYGKPNEQILRAVTRRMWRNRKETFLFHRCVACRAIRTATASLKPSSVSVHILRRLSCGKQRDF